MMMMKRGMKMMRISLRWLATSMVGGRWNGLRSISHLCVALPRVPPVSTDLLLQVQTSFTALSYIHCEAFFFTGWKAKNKHT